MSENIAADYRRFIRSEMVVLAFFGGMAERKEGALLRSRSDLALVAAVLISMLAAAMLIFVVHTSLRAPRIPMIHRAPASSST